jgi:hypothetical protein
MATSTILNWELTRDDIIKGALRKCQVLSKGQVPSAEDYLDATVALNALIQTLSTDGMQLWKRTVETRTLVASQSDYQVNNLWKVAQVVLRDIAPGGTRYDLEQKSLYDLNSLPSSTVGHPISHTIVTQLENATVRLWPAPDTITAANKVIDIVFQRELYTFNAATDTPDFPVYWTETLIYGLAHRLAPEYGLGLQDRQDLLQTFQRLKADAEGYGDEDGSLYFAPNARRS